MNKLRNIESPVESGKKYHPKEHPIGKSQGGAKNWPIMISPDTDEWRDAETANEKRGQALTTQPTQSTTQRCLTKHDERDTSFDADTSIIAVKLVAIN